jgi:glycosyltransferase involved in cell wall biosynthesis
VLTLGPDPGLIREQVDGVTVWRAGHGNVGWNFGAERLPLWKRTLWHLADVYNPLMMKTVRHVVDMERPDIVCIHNLTGWTASIWSELHRMGIPIVQVLHDQYLLCIRSNMFDAGHTCQRQCIKCKMMRLFHPRLSRQVSAVVGVSGFILDKLLRNGYFANVPIREVIRNARHIPNHGVFGDNAGREAGRVDFGYIGSLLSIKGIELLLETFARDAHQDWFLTVAGTGKREYDDSLRRRYAHPRIDFMGRVSPEKFFRKVDVTVVPSLVEDTLPGVVLESLCFGLPVIGSQRGGIPEMVREGVTGVLFDPEEPEGLTASMSAVAARIDDWRSAAPAIRENARQLCDMDGWTERWISLYQRVINGHTDV